MSHKCKPPQWRPYSEKEQWASRRKHKKFQYKMNSKGQMVRVGR